MNLRWKYIGKKTILVRVDAIILYSKTSMKLVSPDFHIKNEEIRNNIKMEELIFTVLGYFCKPLVDREHKKAKYEENVEKMCE